MNYSEEEILQISKLKEERRSLLLEFSATSDPALQDKLIIVKSKLFKLTKNPIYK
jgi:hypothetical protein